MPASNLPAPLRGIVPPMVTPLRDNDTLNVDGLERLVEHTLSGGVHGLFLLGSSGEAPSLSYRPRRELLSVAGRWLETDHRGLLERILSFLLFPRSMR
ncbi:MAG: dihydrodipicolinate synthase family protein [Pirellulaceae bacterium]